MSDKTRATSPTVPKQASGRRTEDSRRKLAEDVFAHLTRSWQRHGREVLVRLRTERPEVYFKAMVRLMKILHHRLPEPPGFDRERARADVLQRLQERATSPSP
jgi:hypothetical protein